MSDASGSNNNKFSSKFGDANHEKTLKKISNDFSINNSKINTKPSSQITSSYQSL